MAFGTEVQTLDAMALPWGFKMPSRISPKKGITIDIDANGIPHIQAQSVEDVFFGQGYMAAYLRMWQLDLQHRRHKGRLAEAFGSNFIEHDHAAKLVQSRLDPAEDWALLMPGIQAIAESFVSGINLRIQELQASPDQLPPEFHLFDIHPIQWHANDLVTIRHCGSPNVKAEFRRALLEQAGRLDLDHFAQILEPAHVLKVPEGLEVSNFQTGQLSLFEKLTDPLPWHLAKTEAQKNALKNSSLTDEQSQGSNAWVIAPKLTESGSSLLANDPHLAFSIPGPRMVSHLMAPGFNVIGAGPVWRPGVQFGHNEHIAFGRTDFQIDQEDLYVLELSPDGQSFKVPHGWETIKREMVSIAVRDETAVVKELALTSLGPIFYEDRSKHFALVLKAEWLQPGACVGLEYVPKLFANDWTSFRQALRSAVWGTNYMYADRQGNIGWQSAGRVPIRLKHDGLMPVPAASGYEWNGILPLDDMPHDFNPECGWIGTANQCPSAKNWPANGKVISFEWKPNDRYRRLTQLLKEISPANKSNIQDSWNYQQDVLSVRATELCTLLAQINEAEKLGASFWGKNWPTVQSLMTWHGRLDKNSTTAVVYAAWWSELQKACRSEKLPEKLSTLIPLLHPHAVTHWLQELAKNNSQSVAKIFQATISLAVELVQKLQVKTKLPNLTWGQIHQVNLGHVLKDKFEMPLREHVDATGGASGGDGATLNARWYASFDQPQVTGGASFRAVVDTSDWESAKAINFPGQSADPQSVHYKDLYPLWINGDSISLHFSMAAVQSHRVQRISIPSDISVN